MNQPNLSLPLYKHEKRPDWGMAILAWERQGRRGYLFEDGTLRVIAESYYQWMKLSQADQPLSETFQRHLSQMDLASTEGLLKPNRAANPTFSIEEQAQLLSGQFPGAFAGEPWLTRHRGADVPKRLKRHRNAAIADAQKTLHPDQIADALSTNEHPEFWQRICAMLRRTDLVAPSEVKQLEQKVVGASRTLTQALSALLHTEETSETAESLGTRFNEYVAELKRLFGGTPSWPVTTSLLALYKPTEYMSIHPSSITQQGRWKNEKPIRTKKPNWTDYERALSFVKTLTQQLEQLDVKPADLLDVYDFIHTTTTPAARKRLAALRQSDLGTSQTAKNQPEGGDDGASSEKASSEKEAA